VSLPKQLFVMRLYDFGITEGYLKVAEELTEFEQNGKVGTYRLVDTHELTISKRLEQKKCTS